MSLLCVLYRIVGLMFVNMINHAEILYALERKCCEAISRLTLAEIEVLYLDGSHAWIKNCLLYTSPSPRDS